MQLMGATINPNRLTIYEVMLSISLTISNTRSQIDGFCLRIESDLLDTAQICWIRCL
jgi:hypothetical protein